MFTQEDYKKIEKYLQSKAQKDSEFNDAETPLDGTELVTLVQNGFNKKLFIKDFVDQLFNLGVSDFLNVTDKYDSYYISLEEAIKLIPYKSRKVGQVITFINKEGNWQIYQFKGVLNQWNHIELWEDLLNLVIDSTLPDEEDLTKSLPDENGNSYLSLKDREYNPEDFSGLGRVILRKNIMEVEDPIYGKIKKNILYQDMFTQSNTIYEIRYDFDLNGQEITIPENCILKYEGGSLNNGHMVYQNTKIQGIESLNNITTEGLFAVIDAAIDEEDLHNNNGVLKFADREYNPNVFSGLGKIILRKNIVNGKNILTQEMIFKPNTIYIIQYDYDLNGAEITIPEGCVLDFQGGSLSNGIIKDANKIINNSNYVIFNNVDFINPLEQFVKLKWWSCNILERDFKIATKFKHVDADGNWTITNPLVVNNDLELVNGKFTCNTGSSFYNFHIYSTDIYEIDYNDIIEKKSKEISVTIPKYYKYVHIQSQDPYVFINEGSTIRKNTRGEIMEISSFTDEKVTFNTEFGTICKYETSIKLVFFNPIKVSISNLNAVAPVDFTTDKNGVIINIKNAEALVKDSYFKGSSIGVSFGNCVNSTITTCTFEEIYPWATAFSGGTCFSTVRNCKFNHNRHAWTTLAETSIAKFNLLTNNICKQSLFALCSHTSSYGTSIIGNTVEDSWGGVGSYAPNCIIKDNVIKECDSYDSKQNIGILLTEAGAINSIIENNVIENKHYFGSCIKVDQLKEVNQYYINPTYLIIKGNTILSPTDAGGIIVDFGNTTSFTPKLIVENNTVTDFGYIGIQLKNVAYCHVKNNTVQNSIRNSQGINIVGNPSINKIYRIATIIGNTCVDCGSDNGHHITVSGMYKVSSYNNESTPSDYTIEYINCEIVKTEKEGLPIATNTSDGLMPKSQKVDLFGDANDTNAYYKLGIYPSKYVSASCIISVYNIGSRPGGTYILNICGTTGTPSVQYTIIHEKAYVEPSIYVSNTEKAVYLTGVGIVSIIWLQNNITNSRNADIATKVETLPDDLEKVSSFLLRDENHYGTVAPDSKYSGFNYYRSDLNILSIKTGNYWKDAFGQTLGVHSGITDNRPTNLNQQDCGYTYFDTDLNKPIYWNGSKWIDATGAEV